MGRLPSLDMCIASRSSRSTRMSAGIRRQSGRPRARASMDLKRPTPAWRRWSEPPDEKAQRSGVREFLIMLSLLAVVLGVLVMVVVAMKRAATDVKHVEHAYDTLSLSRTGIGDSGTFWGAYAAYGAACLFLFAWLGRFPILDALWSSLLAALMAVIFVFAPIFFFVVSIHTVAK